MDNLFGTLPNDIDLDTDIFCLYSKARDLKAARHALGFLLVMYKDDKYLREESPVKGIKPKDF